jgi:hypothetical protein
MERKGLSQPGGHNVPFILNTMIIPPRRSRDSWGHSRPPVSHPDTKRCLAEELGPHLTWQDSLFKASVTGTSLSTNIR